MNFRLRNATGPGAGIGCGGLIAILGLILVSPVGEWLIKGLGWIFIVMGIFIAVSGVYLWMKGPRKDNYL